jgi:hypothetical protein
MRDDHLAFEVLLAAEQSRRRYPNSPQGHLEVAKDSVSTRFRVGHDTIDRALRQFVLDKKKKPVMRVINAQLDLLDQLKAAPESVDVSDIDTDAVTLLADPCMAKIK